MKNYLLGVLSMFLLGFGLQVAWFQGLSSDNDTLFNIGYYGGEAIRGIWLAKPITDRCNVYRHRCNNDPECQTDAGYFGCDSIQIKLNQLIYGTQK